jgi:hypothetical protein
MSAPGIKLACQYSYRTFSLGFCGPESRQDVKVMIHYLLGEKKLEKKVKKMLTKFIGVYPYLQLIAKVNKIKNPFDKKVVEAHWKGNSLLDKIKPIHLKTLIAYRFIGPGLLSKERALKIIRSIPDKVKPQHSFHVLYLGAVTDRIDLKGNLLDICRISWGQVKKVKKDKLEVVYQPLILKQKPHLGRAVRKEIDYEPNFLGKIKIGDWVSFHWNWACERINQKDIINLKKYTELNLKYAKSR